jgi:MFS family permease
MVTEPLLEEFGIATDDGRVLYSSINFWATLLGSLFCLPIGWLLDRYDRRWILAINMAALGLVVMAMSQASTLGTLAVAIFLTRGLGQSALSVASLSIVSKSFTAERLGLAMAWYAVLSVPFHILLIQGVNSAFSIDGISWRTIWMAIGVVLVVLSTTAVFLPARWQDALPTDKPSSLHAEAREGYTLREALATPAFYTFSLTISLWGMIYAGVALFNEDIFRERGFDRSLYFAVLTEVTVVAIASKFVFGWLASSVLLNRLLAVCLAVTACSLVGLTRATETWHAYAYGVGLGIASGAVALLFFTSWGQLYGQLALGQIQGAAQMLTVFASAAGPLIFSMSKRATSNYSTIFMLLGAIMLAMAIASYWTPLPERKLLTRHHSNDEGN